MKANDSATVRQGVSYDDMLDALERAQDIALDHATPKHARRGPAASEKPKPPTAAH
ncbi:hypothetical protein [Pseudonocardia acaciae]|uniref:hypothetical protein n=1 Tax=Pseudonocardia acaciae TaxID=551276 RepID=UPI000B2EE302|nr:hypothetical protein [Pseudonocardia acaciae]